jgi:hypothetical protein
MKWLFLSFIVVLGAAGYGAILSEVTVSRVLGAGLFSTLLASLVGLWWVGYFTTGTSRSRGLVVSHALLMLSAGLGLAFLGAIVLASGSCGALVSSSAHPGLLSRMASFATRSGYCQALGFALGGLGVVVAFPCIQLFVSLARREVSS